MKTATVTELRSQSCVVLKWIEAGKEVAISRRGVVIARLVPERLAPKSNAKQCKPRKAPPYRQMTAALADKWAHVGWGDGRKIDVLAFLQTLR